MSAPLHASPDHGSGPLKALARFRDRVLGRGQAAVTIPAMDGALRPNRALDIASSLADIDEIDNLTLAGGQLFASSGRQLLRLDFDTDASIRCTVVEQMADTVTALAAFEDGGLAIAVEADGLHFRGGRHDGLRCTTLDQRPATCITALAILGDGTLLVTQGMREGRSDDWQSDLLCEGRSGSLWRLQVTAQATATCLMDGLSWPNGLAVEPGNASVLLSESWRHRLLRMPLDAGREVEVALDELPGYPSRLVATASGYWLAVFAPRSQLIEFVLRERRFRERMMGEIPRPFWVAPALRSGVSFKEPLQGGAIKSLGVMKPWAPTRSYGLAVKLDADAQPQASLHSRADGRRHGVTSLLPHGDRLLIASRGGDALLAVDLEGGDTR